MLKHDIAEVSREIWVEEYQERLHKNQNYDVVDIADIRMKFSI